MKKLIFIILPIIFLFACATGKQSYFKPLSLEKLDNSIIINKNKDDVWKVIVPALGKNFFIINNLDKASGIINISYKGDPERYVDCGQIYSKVSFAGKTKVYDFPAALASKNYEWAQDGKLFNINRTMGLEGRMNIIFEEVGPNKTKITVNTRYILTRTIRSQQAGIPYQATNINVISFNSGQQ